MKTNGRKPTTIDLGHTLRRRLKAFARREELTVSQVVRKALKLYLKDSSPPRPQVTS